MFLNWSEVISQVSVPLSSSKTKWAAFLSQAILEVLLSYIYRYLKVYKYVIICKLFFGFCSSLEAYSCFSGLLPLLSPGTLLKSCLRSALDCSGWKLSRRVCWQLNQVWARVASLITDRCFSSFHLLQNDVVAEGAWITVPALGGTVFLEWALRWFLHWAQE